MLKSCVFILLLFCPYYSNSYDLTLPDFFWYDPFGPADCIFIDTISTAFRSSSSFYYRPASHEQCVLHVREARPWLYSYQWLFIIQFSTVIQKRISFFSLDWNKGAAAQGLFYFMVEDIGELIPLVRDDMIDKKTRVALCCLPREWIQPCSRWGQGCGTPRRAWLADMNQLRPLDILFMHLVAPSYLSAYGFWLLRGLNYDEEGALGWGYKQVVIVYR